MAEVSIEELINVINSGVQFIADMESGVLLESIIKQLNFKISIEETRYIRSKIETFYDDFTRTFYKPTGSLPRVVKVEPTNEGWEVKYNWNVLNGHHQDAEIIKNNVFMKGYHGGSGGTDSNGESRDIGWRTPANVNGPEKFSRWSDRIVEQSESPNNLAEKAIDEFESNEEYIQNLMHEAIIKIVSNYYFSKYLKWK